MPFWKTRKTTHAQTIYEPLHDPESIRVLELYPGRGDDQIRCKLKVVTSKSLERTYEAISYTWGDPNITVDIICNKTAVPITVSLADALQRFREPRRARLLWADALCIDQKNDEEKSHQVQRMYLVFSNAKRVLVWLGRDPNGIAVDCFERMKSVNQYCNANFGVDIRRLAHPYPDCFERIRWPNVESLFALPWFIRSWVVQEVSLAKDCYVFWGTCKAEVAEIFEFLVWCWSKTDLLMEGGGPLISLDIFINVMSKYNNPRPWWYLRPALRHWAEKMYSSANFVTVLSAARVLEATDGRDHIYAFLGSPYAQSPSGKPLVEVDYTKSTEEVHMDTACAMLQHPGNGPWTLSAVKHRSLADFHDGVRPSWVPSWDIGTPDMHPIADPNYWYEAGGPIGLFTAQVSNNNVLGVEGFFFDKVVWMSSVILDSELSLNPDLWSGDDHIKGETFLDSLWDEASQEIALTEDDFTLTLVGGYPRYKLNRYNIEMHRRHFDAYRRVARSSLRSASTSSPAMSHWEVVRVASLITQNMVASTHGMRLILTANGRIGVAQGGATEIGDVCCIFPGATVPFILKPSREGRYKLVGDCYVHGVMGGETMEQMRAGKYITERILLE